MSNWFGATISLSFLREATLEHDFDAIEKKRAAEIYAAVRSMDMEIGNSPKSMDVVPEVPPRERDLRHSEVRMLCKPPGYATVRNFTSSTIAASSSRLSRAHDLGSGSPELPTTWAITPRYGGLIFTLVAVAKWIMALSGLKGSNCLQPSLVDGSAAGTFHRAEVWGWTCAPLSDVSCLWLVRSSHACRPDGKSATFCHLRGSVANRSTLE